MAKTKTVPLATLVEDLALYPRHRVDEANVSRLTMALKSGATLPPLIVEAGSMRIVDGWHRARAYRRVLGAEAVVDVEPRVYASEAELFLEAARLNSGHGQGLARIDEVRIITIAEEKGATREQVAQALHITLERAMKLSVRLAMSEGGGNAGPLRVALKRPAAHLAGRMLTQDQVAAHDRAPGVSYLLIANQLAEGIQSGLLDETDERLRAALVALHGVIEAHLLGG